MDLRESIMTEKQFLALSCGQVVKHHRYHKKWTIREFSQKAKIGTSTLSRIERGEVLPDLYAARKIEKQVGMEPGELSVEAQRQQPVRKDTRQRTKHLPPEAQRIFLQTLIHYDLNASIEKKY